MGSAEPTPDIRHPKSGSTPVRIKPKVGKNILSCATIALLIAAVIFSLLALAVAKTGAVRLPLFSRLYRGPAPTRLVNAEPMSIDAFRVLIGSRFFSQLAAGKRPPYTVRVTEKELTGALENAIDTALRDQTWKQVFTQIVVRPTDLEFLSRFENGPLRFDILARIIPSLKDGGVSFEPVYMQIGDYRLPPSVAYNAVSLLFSRDLGTFTLKFGDAALSGLRLSDGALEISASQAAPLPSAR